MIHEQTADISDDRLETEQLEQAKENENTTSSDNWVYPSLTYIVLKTRLCHHNKWLLQLCLAMFGTLI